MLIGKMEKGAVGAVRGHIGPFFIAGLVLINALPVHPFIKGTAVIEHAVQDHLHSPTVNLLHQPDEKLIAGLQIFFPGDPVNIPGRLHVVFCPAWKKGAFIHHDFSDMGINVVIVLNIVFMIGGGYEQGVKIDHIHSQLFQVVQLPAHPFQISAVKLPDAHGGGPFSPVCHPPGALFDINVLIVQHIVGFISVEEAVRIDLIHHRPLGPVRRGKSGLYGKCPAVAQVPGHSHFIVKAVHFAALNLKEIPKRLLAQLYLRHIIIKKLFMPLQIHLLLQRSADEINRIHVIPAGPEADRHRIAGFGLHGGYIVFCLIGKKGVAVKHGAHLQNIFGSPQGLFIALITHTVSPSCLSLAVLLSVRSSGF